jgi:hypothetical protein
MTTERQKKMTPLVRGRRWPVALPCAAQRCGVSVTQLSEVLLGNRPSQRVSRKYAELIAELEKQEAAKL